MMEKLRSDYPVCDRCDLALQTVRVMRAPQGGLITIFKCTKCNRLFWREPKPEPQG
jgi:uncharacterized protein with PIN domain